MRKLAFCLALASFAPAQEFEVASIRPAIQDGDHDSDGDQGFYKVHNYTLKRLVAEAWQIDASVVSGGSGWVDSNSYDITAKIPPVAPGQKRADYRVMIQNLLAERFHLVIHWEPHRISGYELVLAKKGPKLERAKPGDGSESHSNGSRLTATNVTMEAFARRLSRDRDIGKLVVDKTGLTGGFNFMLAWMPEKLEAARDASPDESPSIFAAIQEQLGLRLEAAKVAVQAVVIDRAEKPEVDQ
jgi:uncharacterized protein (TIGR03435 family)